MTEEQRKQALEQIHDNLTSVDVEFSGILRKYNQTDNFPSEVKEMLQNKLQVVRGAAIKLEEILA